MPMFLMGSSKAGPCGMRLWISPTALKAVFFCSCVRRSWGSLTRSCEMAETVLRMIPMMATRPASPAGGGEIPELVVFLSITLSDATLIKTSTA